MKKKILWIVLLIIVVVIAVAVIINARPKEINKDTASTTQFNKNTNVTNEETTISNKEEVEKKQFQKVELEDGILYSENGEKVKSDIVIGDNYFDTTITDMYLNPQNYENKNIEIEGMYLANLPYTFVGRFSNSNLCAYCPVGYSYLEYQLNGTIDRELIDEKDWIKVVGTLNKGNDETSGYEDFYYLDVIYLEIMNKRGQDTVNN